MSEVEKDASVVAGEVESKEIEPTTAEEKTEAPSGEVQTSEITAEPEVKETTETEQNGHAKNGDKNEKSGDREKDEIDEKIDRYARETKRPFQKRKQHVRSNFENLPETDDPEEIRRQVEFYFSDANLPQDAFLLKSTGGPKNQPFPLKQLHTFKRMRRFQPYSAVLDAVKESKVLDVNKDGEVTRKTPLSEDYDPEDVEENKRIYEQKSMARSIYAKGFGEETETTQTDIEEFFGPYGDVSAVRLRRHHDGNFKGTVLVEFSDEETAKSFLELDPKPKWQGKYELEFKTKKAWVEEKEQQEKDRPRRDYGDRRDNKRKFEGGRGGRYNDDRRGGKNQRRGGRGGRDDRGDRRRDRNDSRERRRDRDGSGEEDWRDRRDRDNRDSRDKRRDRRDDRRSKRDRDDENDKREAQKEHDSGDEVNKLANKSNKRSRDDNDAAAEPEAKKVKEDESKSENKAPEEVSAAA
ncbi:La domain-containing protein 2 [Elsinoe australis]|uniref:La domain-containing protein 2 n=1 Tax=Elsinoe australis TaxID=40998 RepID=A0A4U7AVK2_9PEZI|nr:La domain-containing protein 2 [Elsinoe australis]